MKRALSLLCALALGSLACDEQDLLGVLPGAGNTDAGSSAFRGRSGPLRSSGSSGSTSAATTDANLDAGRDDGASGDAGDAGAPVPEDAAAPSDAATDAARAP